MHKKKVLRRDRPNPRLHMEPNTGPNRATRREKHISLVTSSSTSRVKEPYTIKGRFKSLISALFYSPPGRHFGKHTQPIQKKGKRSISV